MVNKCWINVESIAAKSVTKSVTGDLTIIYFLSNIESITESIDGNLIMILYFLCSNKSAAGNLLILYLLSNIESFTESSAGKLTILYFLCSIESIMATYSLFISYLTLNPLLATYSLFLLSKFESITESVAKVKYVNRIYYYNYKWDFITILKCYFTRLGI